MNLEFNKITASVLIAAIAFMFCGYASDMIYSKGKMQTPKMDMPTNQAEAGAEGAKKVEEVVISEIMKTASAENGKSLFKKCASCHSIDDGGANRVGPNLWGVFGAQSGKNPTYLYSKAFESHAGVWGYEELYHYLYNPKEYIPGNKMSFVGLRNPKDIADVIAYLRSCSPAGG